MFQKEHFVISFPPRFPHREPTNRTPYLFCEPSLVFLSPNRPKALRTTSSPSGSCQVLRVDPTRLFSPSRALRIAMRDLRELHARRCQRCILLQPTKCNPSMYVAAGRDQNPKRPRRPGACRLREMAYFFRFFFLSQLTRRARTLLDTTLTSNERLPFETFD